MRTSTIWFITILFSRALFSQSYGHVDGFITDEKTGTPLYGANIIVENTLLGNASDMEGHFLIQNVPAGPSVLQISMIGYEKKSISVNILPGAQQSVDVQLSPAILKQPTLVITATKRNQNIEDAPTTVDVIPADEILKRNPTTLDQVLVNTAGVGIIDGQIELRGSTGFNWAAGSRVLLLIDGHPMIGGDTGGINWDALPVEDVERVEIVKGAGSALYGSNAMAGMVNIITREPTPETQIRYRLYAGFYDEPAYSDWRWSNRFLTYKFLNLKDYDPRGTLSFQGANLSYSKKFNDFGVLLSLGDSRSLGYQQNGDYIRRIGMLKTTYKFGPQTIWMLTGHMAYEDHGEFLQWESQSSPMVVPQDELGNRIQYTKASVRSTFSKVLNPSMAFKVKSNWYRTDWQNNFPGQFDYAKTDRFGSEVQMDLLLNQHSLTMGTEGIYTKTRSRIFGNCESWDGAVYIEDEIKFTPLWTLTAGTRTDVHQIPDISTDWQISPRAGLVCRPQLGTSLRMSAGYGFRAPSLAEVFSTVNVAGVRVIPNLDLKKAERAVSTEIGINQIIQIPQNQSSDMLQWFHPVLSLDAALFANWYKNMIDIMYNESLKSFQFMNLGRARTWGIETQIQLSLWKGFMIAHCGWTWLNHKDLETGKPLPYRSNNRVVTGGEIHLGRWLFGLDYRYASRQREIVSLFEGDERVPMHVLDGRIQYTFGEMSLSIEGKNLRNYNYTLRQRLLEPIRNFTLTLRGEL